MAFNVITSKRWSFHTHVKEKMKLISKRWELETERTWSINEIPAISRSGFCGDVQQN